MQTWISAFHVHMRGNPRTSTFSLSMGPASRRVERRSLEGERSAYLAGCVHVALAPASVYVPNCSGSAPVAPALSEGVTDGFRLSFIRFSGPEQVGGRDPVRHSRASAASAIVVNRSRRERWKDLEASALGYDFFSFPFFPVTFLLFRSSFRSAGCFPSAKPRKVRGRKFLSLAASTERGALETLPFRASSPEPVPPSFGPRTTAMPARER